MTSEIDLAMLSATFDALPDHEPDVAAILAKYVVLARHLPHCRNVDLVVSTTERGRFLVVEKWDSDAEARAHLNSDVLVEMAGAVVAHLASQPVIDLWDTISAHDLH